MNLDAVADLVAAVVGHLERVLASLLVWTAISTALSHTHISANPRLKVTAVLSVDAWQIACPAVFDGRSDAPAIVVTLQTTLSVKWLMCLSSTRLRDDVGVSDVDILGG